MGKRNRMRNGSGQAAGVTGKLGHEFRKLDASTEEEIDALKVDLFQEDERPTARDGSGLVVDEVAEAEVANFTEAGPPQMDPGVESLVPGRDNTSTILRRHQPNTEVARDADVVEVNLDEPQDEVRTQPKADERRVA